MEEANVEILCKGHGRAVLSTGRRRAGPLTSLLDKAVGHQEMKDCFVVLNRLDEKLLNRYLRRRKDTFPFRSCRKRRKVRPLCYTDDEDDPAEAKPSENCSENDRSAQVDSRAMKDTKQESKEMGCELAWAKKKGLPVENDSSHCSSVKSEMEIIKESIVRSSRGNVICDKTICDVNFIYQDESNHQELDDLDESRDDGEDDRSTVIFEKDTDLDDVFELEEKEISQKLKKKKLTNRNKITNRKKQRLVKFKRKSITGRNLGKIRKSKSKVFESGGGGLDMAEKSVNDCIAEDKLREICASLRRLHEMYTIILQLQKEMPNDTELTYHFKRVINAQRENFHEEIRKSQKVIIKSFEKILKSSNKSLDSVAVDIGKRAYLTADEVIYILSLCILSEGSYDIEKSRSGSAEKTEQPKSSTSSVRRTRVTKKATQPKSSKSKVLSSQSSCQEVVNTEVPSVAPPPLACNPPAAVSDHPVGQGSAESRVTYSMDQVCKACPQPYNYCQPEKSNQRFHFWAPQNFESSRIYNSGARQFREMNPPPVVRQPAPSTQPPITMPDYCNVPYANQNSLYPFRPRPPFNTPPAPLNCALNTPIGHYQRGSNFPPVYRDVQGRTSGFPPRLLSERQCNYVPDKPNANQIFGSPVLVQSTPGYGAVPNRISNQPHTLNTAPTQRSCHFPNLENIRCNLVNGEVILTPTGESQCQLDFSQPVRHYNAAAEESLQERLRVPVEVGDRSTEINPTAKADSEVSEILDPTIPQKLTMKNCRLQAGPILCSANSPEEKPKCGALENRDQEHSRSRTYICAEDGCKNPGLRICTFCQSVIYCSNTCQRKHWNLKHKDECCQLKELRG